MKVGMITFHSAHNFGAVLQAYALNKKIIDIGYEAEIIDYRPQFITELYSINPFHKLSKPKSLISLLSMYPTRIKKYNKFNKFINEEMKLSERSFYSSEDLIKYSFNYDIYVTGSDQVWNPEINGVMGEYFLSFAGTQSKRISYAASFGKDTLNSKFSEEISFHLKKLDAISVREEDGVNIVNNLIGLNPLRVLDPVFLLSSADWKEKIVAPDITEKYILVYMMEYNKKVIDIAVKVAEEKNMKILNISNSVKIPRGFEKNLRDIGPREFLGYFYFAEHVITNSFHGTAFSIIFEKNFTIVPHSKLNSRIDNILKLTNLEERQVNLSDEDESFRRFTSEIEFDEVRQILKKEIDYSVGYLQEALNRNR